MHGPKPPEQRVPRDLARAGTASDTGWAVVAGMVPSTACDQGLGWNSHPPYSQPDTGQSPTEAWTRATPSPAGWQPGPQCGLGGLWHCEVHTARRSTPAPSRAKDPGSPCAERILTAVFPRPFVLLFQRKKGVAQALPCPSPWDQRPWLCQTLSLIPQGPGVKISEGLRADRALEVNVICLRSPHRSCRHSCFPSSL